MKVFWDPLDEIIARMQADWGVPGVAAAIVQNGEVVYAKGFGTREQGRDLPVDGQTVFAIGSNTKAFTATAAGMLVQEGKLSWDDPVTRYLPGFQLSDPVATREMTVRDLLCHRSGLLSYAGDFMSYGTSYASDEVLQRVRYVKPAYPFRATFGYSNIMFLAAGKIVEAVSGQTWQAFLQQRLLGPLGMTRTSTSVTGLEGQDNVAQPHVYYHGQLYQIPYANIDSLAPAGSINSSVLDIAGWLRFQLASGCAGSQQLVDPAILEETRTPHTLIPITADFRQLVPRRHFAAYGLGWVLSDYAGRLVVSHDGGVDGMLSQVAFLPEEQLGLVILTNRYPNRLYPALFYTILDLALGLPARDWNAAMLEQDRKERAKADAQRQKLEESRLQGTHPSLPLDSYTGSYTNPVYGKMTVSLENGRLALHPAGHPGLSGPLEHWHVDTFLCVWSSHSYDESFVHFQAGLDGKAERLRLKVADFIDLQEYEFTREN